MVIYQRLSWFFLIAFGLGCVHGGNELQVDNHEGTAKIFKSGWVDSVRIPVYGTEYRIKYVVDPKGGSLYLLDGIQSLFRIDLESGRTLKTVECKAQYRYSYGKNELVHSHPFLVRYNGVGVSLYDTNLTLLSDLTDSLYTYLQREYRAKGSACGWNTEAIIDTIWVSGKEVSIAFEYCRKQKDTFVIDLTALVDSTSN